MKGEFEETTKSVSPTTTAARYNTSAAWKKYTDNNWLATTVLPHVEQRRIFAVLPSSLVNSMLLGAYVSRQNLIITRTEA